MSRTYRKNNFHCSHHTCTWCYPDEKYLMRVVGWKKRVKARAKNVTEGSD